VASGQGDAEGRAAAVTDRRAAADAAGRSGVDGNGCAAGHIPCLGCAVRIAQSGDGIIRWCTRAHAEGVGAGRDAADDHGGRPIGVGQAPGLASGQGDAEGRAAAVTDRRAAADAARWSGVDSNSC